VTDLARCFPVLASRDWHEALALYGNHLGFHGETRAHSGILRRDKMEIHFRLARDRVHPEHTSCHIRGGLVPAPHAEFAARNVPGLSAFDVKPWDMKTFRPIDPPGNLLHFGCARRRPARDDAGPRATREARGRLAGAGNHPAASRMPSASAARRGARWRRDSGRRNVVRYDPNCPRDSRPMRASSPSLRGLCVREAKGASLISALEAADKRNLARLRVTVDAQLLRFVCRDKAGFSWEPLQETR
jgi:hypothetical protein